MDTMVPLAIITALVLLNALFVAAEFAIVGAPRAAIEHRAREGQRLARTVMRVLDDPTQQDRYIATAQLGVTVASLGLGMYGEHVIATWVAARLEVLDASRWIAAHTVAGVIALGLLTYAHIVIGEMVPKALALQQAERAAMYVTPVIRALQRILLPLVVALNAIGNRVLVLLGIPRQDAGAERYHSTEELQFIIRESEAGGLLRGEAGQLLRELFEFGDLTAGEVMVPRVRVTGIPVGTGTEELRAVLRRAPHTRYPVYEHDLDHIVGTIHIKLLLRHLMNDEPVRAWHARPLPHVPEAMALDQVLGAMRRGRAQMAVVMDEHGGTAGIVTIEDLFDEVVGEIQEGRGRRPIDRDPSGGLRVRGTVRLEELGDALERTLEHEEVDTVSGLVLTLLGRPPAVGDVVRYAGLRFQVTAVEGRGVREATATIETDDKAEGGSQKD